MVASVLSCPFHILLWLDLYFVKRTENNVIFLKRELEFEGAAAKGKGELNGGIDKDAIGKRLEEIYKRLELIDADSVESRAASILAVSSHIFCVFDHLKAPA